MTLLILTFFLCILTIANRAEKSDSMRQGLYLFLSLINIGLVLLYGLAPALGLPKAAEIPSSAGLTAFVISLIASGIAFGLMQLSIRQRLARFFTPSYNPTSYPQMTAMIFCVYLFANVLLNFVLAGGMSGLAQDFDAPTANSVLLQCLVFVSVALVGAGFPVRRGFYAVARRLGLHWPTIEEMSVAFLVSIGLVLCAFFVGTLWTSFTPQEVLKEQTQVSRLISQSVNTLTFAFLIAACAAVGEEIAFRGALQPIFGLWPTAVFFALTHIQYTLTPATLLIIIVGVGLGWIRKRYNTTAAIITHFMYDFALLFLSIYARYLMDLLQGASK